MTIPLFAGVTLTHRWGTVEDEALREEFRSENLPDPHIVESDASDPAAARALMREVRRRTPRLSAIISKVAFARPVAAGGSIEVAWSGPRRCRR